MRRRRPGAVRIIGGEWRGTRLIVAEHAQLRPTTDRVRETVFNWLAPVLPGARCLDLFAGSGALGFEAVSRGAAYCDLIEHDALLASALEAARTRLRTHRVSVQSADALEFLARPPAPYDVVFVDPPFDSGLHEAVLERLAAGWLRPHALIYVEHARDRTLAAPDYALHRQGRTREVCYQLLVPAPRA